VVETQRLCLPRHFARSSRRRRRRRRRRRKRQEATGALVVERCCGMT